MSAQMNNKYDVGNFSKLLEEYNNEGELAAIEKHLFPDRVNVELSPDIKAEEEEGSSPAKSNNSMLQQHKFEYVPYESKKYNIS